MKKILLVLHKKVTGLKKRENYKSMQILKLISDLCMPQQIYDHTTDLCVCNMQDFCFLNLPWKLQIYVTQFLILQFYAHYFQIYVLISLLPQQAEQGCVCCR